MEIIELITSPETLEPETIRYFYPELSSNDYARILATKVALQTNIPYENIDVFENLMYVLNNIDYDVLKMEGCTPEIIWNGVEALRKIRKDFELSYDVQMYIKYIYNSNGYFFYPENIGIDNPFLAQIKERADEDDYLNENFLDIQTYKYKKITGNK